MSSQLKKVVQELRGQILRGELRAGERITETAAAKMLDVSRTPVRLALSILEQEDLVEGETNKGFRVREFSAKDYEESLAVRATIDGMAARLAAENGLAPDIEDDLDQVIKACDKLLEKAAFEITDLQIFGKWNNVFHDSLAAASGNDSLRRLLEREMPLRFRTALLIFDHDPGKARDLIRFAHDDHIGILEAVKSGEGTRAEYLMREHVQNPHRISKKMIAEMGLTIEHESKDIMAIATRSQI
jgi:GntR family transcriptional regulator of vanillate catabolism